MDRLRQVVRSLLRGETVGVPARKHLPAETVVPRAVTIVEGHLCLCISWLAELLDLRICVDMDAEERLLRRVQRNVLERSQKFGARGQLVSQGRNPQSPPVHRAVQSGG